MPQIFSEESRFSPTDLHPLKLMDLRKPPLAKLHVTVEYPQVLFIISLRAKRNLCMRSFYLNVNMLRNSFRF